MQCLANPFYYHCLLCSPECGFLYVHVTEKMFTSAAIAHACLPVFSVDSEKSGDSFQLSLLLLIECVGCFLYARRVLKRANHGHSAASAAASPSLDQLFASSLPVLNWDELELVESLDAGAFGEVRSVYV